MFHCHVQDHMESGMMAVYTVYSAPTRSCPLSFVGGDLWLHPEIFTLRVKNTGSKTITSLAVTSEMFLAPQDLRRPFNSGWTLTKPIAPGQEETLEKQGIRASSAQAVLGWVFFPYSVRYRDGTVWRPQSEGECFDVIWRDQIHPDLSALPPRQIEMNPD